MRYYNAMKVFFGIVATMVALGILVASFILYRIHTLRPVAREVTQSLFSAVVTHDAAAANAIFAPELLREYPEAVDTFLPYMQAVASIADYKEWYVGGYSFGLGGQKYTYRFVTTYTDGGTGKGVIRFIQKRGGGWHVYSVELVPDKE